MPSARNGVLTDAYDETNVRLTVVDTGAPSGEARPTDEEGVWGLVHNRELHAIRVVYV